VRRERSSLRGDSSAVADLFHRMVVSGVPTQLLGTRVVSVRSLSPSRVAIFHPRAEAKYPGGRYGVQPTERPELQRLSSYVPLIYTPGRDYAIIVQTLCPR
jgi:hypothetical protein